MFANAFAIYRSDTRQRNRLITNGETSTLPSGKGLPPRQTTQSPTGHSNESSALTRPTAVTDSKDLAATFHDRFARYDLYLITALHVGGIFVSIILVVDGAIKYIGAAL